MLARGALLNERELLRKDTKTGLRDGVRDPKIIAMINRFVRVRCLARVVAAAAVLLMPTICFGQINDPSVKPDNIELLKGGAPVLEYALAGGFLLAALAIAFKPSKRGMEKSK